MPFNLSDISETASYESLVEYAAVGAYDNSNTNKMSKNKIILALLNLEQLKAYRDRILRWNKDNEDFKIFADQLLGEINRLIAIKAATPPTLFATPVEPIFVPFFEPM